MDKLPRINIYMCLMGHHTVTVDVDHGVTPFMIPCEREGCPATAKSSFYPKGPDPLNRTPTHEWYKPKSLKGLTPMERHHVEKGGLLLRKRTDATPRYHGEEAPSE